MATLTRPRAATRMAAHTRLGLVWALLLVVGCGDPMASYDYLGEPLASFSGAVIEESVQGLIHRDDLRAAVFWAPCDALEDDLEQLEEEPGTAQPVGIPNDYLLHMFDIPDPRVRITMGPNEDGDYSAYAIGRILVYPDENENGRRDADEAFLGGILHTAILYAPYDLPAELSPGAQAIPAGFHLVMLPLFCGSEGPRGETDETCSVPLGEPCEFDSECEGGVCLMQQPFLPFPWPGGACAIPENANTSCRPEGAGFVSNIERVTGIGHWVKGCTVDEECVREDPYHCDVGAGGCVPDWMLQIVLTATPAVTPFCVPGVGQEPVDYTTD